MIFSKVQIQNFLSFKKDEFLIDSAGLTLVLGDNQDGAGKDSNGAGKSSLLDSLCWALWGVTIRGLKDDAVIKRQVGKNCKVSVHFQDEENTYVVTRYRKCKELSPHNGLLLTINDEDATGAKVALTQERINKILDMDFHTFSCMMPGSKIKLAALTDSGIKNTLEGLLQLEVFSEAQKLAKAQLAELAKEQAQLASELASYQRELEVHEVTKKELEDNIASFEQKKARELATLTSTESGLYEDIAAIVINVSEEDLLEKQRVLAAEKAKLEEELNNCRNYLASLVLDENKENNKLQLDLSLSEAAIKSLEGAIHNTQSLTGSYPVCAQEVGEVHKAKIVEQYQQDLEEHKGRRRTVLEEISVVKSDYVIAKGMASESIVTVGNSLADTSTQLNTIALDIDSLRSIKSNKQALESQLVRVQEQLQDKQNETCSVLPMLTRVNEDMDKLNQDVVSTSADLDILNEKARKCEFWVEAFGTKGLRPHLLKHITPLLNSRVQKYADTATNGDMKIEFQTEKKLKNGDTRSIFAVKVTNKDGGESYQSSSSGERARADVCIALALGDLAASRSSKNINFRFMDEPFENLDDAGLAGIVALLTQQNKDFGNVFCVTHNKTLKEYFPHTITVVKKDTVSKLYGQ